MNDAFSCSHRAHASLHAITKFLPSFSGLLLDEEVKALTSVLNSPVKPVAALVGGAKISSKINIIEYLLTKMENSQSNEIRSLKMQVAKLQLESKLRRNLASEIDKQKQIAKNAEEIAKEKSREIEGIASQLSKYLSPQLFSSIFSGEKKVLIESERKFLTVFFSDIVSFTSISDNMDSAPLTEMLNLYLTKMSEIALKYGGTIDKYIGDSVMIFFGDPQTAGKNQDAINCVKMAIEMQSTMKKLSKVFMNDFNLLNPLNIRVGINSGECTVGNFGSEKRLDYTVIGGTVNLASRLESKSPIGKILISEKTKSLIINEIDCKKYDEIKVKGFKENINTFTPVF